MIRDVFLPERVGSYYLFPQRIVGFDIGRTHVTATKLLCAERTMTVETVLRESLGTAGSAEYAARVAVAIRALLTKLGKYDSLRVAVSSGQTIFKELKVPFTDPDKISMVLPYEVAPLLPFSLEESFLDFVITRMIPEQNSTELMVAAVKRDVVYEYQSYFAEAGVRVDAVCVDLINLYNLFRLLPAEQRAQDMYLLLDVAWSATRLAYIERGQLKVVRNLPEGLNKIVKTVSQATQLDPRDVSDHLLRHGVEQAGDARLSAAVRDAFSQVLERLRFSITSVMTLDTLHPAASTIYLCGGGAECKGLPLLISSLFGVDAELFPIEQLHAAQVIKYGSAVTKVAPGDVLSVSIAVPLVDDLNGSFNLLKEVQDKASRLFVWQFCTTLFLTLCILGVLIAQGILKVHAMRDQLAQAQNSTISLLKDNFALEGRSKRLNDVVDEATRSVNREADIWFAFSHHQRASFLKYLQELSGCIDRQELGLDLRRVAFTDDEITLEGGVNSYESLIKLENELSRSKLFGNVPQPESRDPFVMVMSLKNDSGGDV